MDIFNRFFNIINDTKNPVIFEFGTCDGQHTNILCSIVKQLGKEFKYFAFEADPRIMDSFYQNNRNHLSELTVVHGAIGNTDGQVTFNLSGGVESREGHFKQSFYGSSSIKKPKLVTEFWPDMTFQETNVQCYKFDTYYKMVNPGVIDFIWADVQGAENDLIKGGMTALSNTRYFYTEYCDQELYDGEIGKQDIINMLPGDWELIEDYGGDILLKNKKFS